MMTDFRALCAELTAWAEKTSAHYFQPPDVLLRARAALGEVDEPAVPDGREPASVTAKPSDEDSTVMEIIELSSEIEAAGLGQVDFARAVLARWGRPAPAPPADGEVAELVGKLVEAANGAAAMGWDHHAQRILRAAKLLQWQVPVSVRERLPRPEDCDSHGWCWVLYSAHSTWTLEPPYGQDGMPTGWTHWLPAHALPLPEVGK